MSITLLCSRSLAFVLALCLGIDMPRKTSTSAQTDLSRMPQLCLMHDLKLYAGKAPIAPCDPSSDAAGEPAPAVRVQAGK